MKLDEETQDDLILYKLNVKRIPDDYESFIQKISKAVECEIRIKLFEGFRKYWKENMPVKLKTINDGWINQKFKWNYNSLKSFLEEDKFLELKSLYFILSTLIEKYSFHKIPKEYLTPFEKFKEYIGIKNMKLLGNITKFFNKKYKCGNEYHYFIDIRNKCSHGGGKIQEKRKKIEILIEKDTFLEIEDNLLNEDVYLLKSFCSLKLN